LITGKPNSEDKMSTHFKEATRRHPCLKKLQEKKYLFPASDLLGLLDDLLEKGIIELPESRRLKEDGRTADPNYC